MPPVSRRALIKTAILAGTASIFSRSLHAQTLTPTPDETPGPFYPNVPQQDKDFDMTSIAGKQGVAKGQLIQVEGQVLNTEGKPLSNAVVDIWQANAAGRYRHQFDNSAAPLDENFQGWTLGNADSNGRFVLKTIMPGAYAVNRQWQRPPHIHFKISQPGYVTLTTQMYFPDQPLNAVDFLINSKPRSQRSLMITQAIAGQKDRYFYQVVLKKA